MIYFCFLIRNAIAYMYATYTTCLEELIRMKYPDCNFSEGSQPLEKNSAGCCMLSLCVCSVALSPPCLPSGKTFLQWLHILGFPLDKLVWSRESIYGSERPMFYEMLTHLCVFTVLVAGAGRRTQRGIFYQQKLKNKDYDNGFGVDSWILKVAELLFF